MGSHAKKIKILLGTLVALSLLAVGAIIAGYWFIVPSIAEDALRQKLGRLEERAKLSISPGSIEPDGLKGVRIRDFKVLDPNAEEGHSELLTIDVMVVNIDKAKLLTGKKVISSLSLDGATLHVHRGESGEINIARILKNMRGSRKEDETRSAPQGDRAPSFLRHFGGQWPELDVRDVAVEFSSNQAPFPLSFITTERVSLSPDGDEAAFETTLSLTASPDAPAHISLPSLISSKGSLALPLEQSALSFNFDRPFNISNLPYLPPSLRIGLSDVELSEGGKIALTALTLEDASAPDASPLFAAKRAEIQLERFTTSLSTIRPLSVLLDTPSAHLHVREDGEVALLSSLLRGKKQEDTVSDAADAPKDEATKSKPAPEPGKLDRIKQRIERLELTQLASRLPHTIDIKNAHLTVRDDRANHHQLVSHAPYLHAQDVQVQLRHDEQSGSLTLESSFAALASEDKEATPSTRGHASLSLSANYKTHLLELAASAKSLDLSWFAQIAPIDTVSRYLKGGSLHAELSMTRQRDTPLSFSGDVSIERGHLVHERLAEEPLTDWSLGYAFKGTYDANASIPDAKLLKTALDANVPEDPTKIGKSKRRITIPPPTKGALVVTKGRLRAGEVEADFVPALYGLDASKPLPARLDLLIKLPSTPIQALLDATPDALLGRVAEAKIHGAVHMNFALEVPLYDASNMVWSGEPETSNAEIVHLPEEVDVRRMVESFTHTIDDEKVLYTRTITLPSMQLIPSQWLAENAALDPHQIDRHWGRGGWLSMQDGLIDKGQTRWKTASKPWIVRDDSRIVRYWKPFREGQTTPSVSSPYGPYTFVPLQHIAHWLIRGVLTTEDNSFFKHDGFNRLALRQSIERDLAEGDYVRGASTISMQLIKNLYLTRKKVLARKIQEAILVWLTESVVRVPKGRMLEVYLNVIEFAPGVFGIHDAAVHYFGKRPDELTLAECAWLVTIVPGPKFYHKHFMRGEMSDHMFTRIKRYMAIMHKRERVTEEELAAASLTKPLFHQPELREPAIAPLPKTTSEELESLFPDLFDRPSEAINPFGPPRIPTQTPRPIPPVTPTPRAQPDPPPPTIRLR